MVQKVIQGFVLSNRLLVKILDPYMDLVIYLFNGLFIGTCLYLSLLSSSQEIILTYSALQELFKDFTFLLLGSNLFCLITTYPVPSKQFFRGCLLLIIGFLVVICI